MSLQQPSNPHGDAHTDAYADTYEGLVQLVERLRGPDGCPWDREQTHHSMKRYIVEECYELIDAIERDNGDKLIEELGDVLFHVIFQMQLAVDAGEFGREQVYREVIQKLVRRHPHVFEDGTAKGPREIETTWDEIKRRERQGTEESTIDGVPKQMPALAYAQAVHARAARTGFDWNSYQGVLDKVAEELSELRAAESDTEREREMGDVLASVVNAARWLKVDAESALRGANARFYRRFTAMERASRERGLDFADLSLDEKEALWQEAKAVDPRR